MRLHKMSATVALDDAGNRWERFPDGRWARGICGVVVNSSWHDRVACAFSAGHEGAHSWASIPAFDPRLPRSAA